MRSIHRRALVCFALLCTLLAIAGAGIGQTPVKPIATLPINVAATGAVTGVVPVVNGGTGISSPGLSGNYLKSTGSAWVSTTFPLPSPSTSGNLLQSDGTNWTSAAPLLPAPSTSGNVLTSNGSAWTSAAPTGGGSTKANAFNSLSSDVSTTSTSYADLISQAMTTGASKVRVVFNFGGEKTTSAGTVFCKLQIDGVDATGVSFSNSGGFRTTFGLVWVSSTLSAASHTFLVRWKIDTSGARAQCATLPTEQQVTLSLQEL